MSRRSPTWISPGIIMSSPGVPWQAWDSRRGQISQIHQRLRPIFKWRSPPGNPQHHHHPAISLTSLSRKSKDACRQQQGSLMQSRTAGSVQYLIWIQDAFSPVLLATQFHIHYILLSCFVSHFTPCPHQPAATSLTSGLREGF